MVTVDTSGRLEELYTRNDEIERAVAKINRHGRREHMSDDETDQKNALLTELNNVINEIERLNATRTT